MKPLVTKREVNKIRIDISGQTKVAVRANMETKGTTNTAMETITVDGIRFDATVRNNVIFPIGQKHSNSHHKTWRQGNVYSENEKRKERLCYNNTEKRSESQRRKQSNKKVDHLPCNFRIEWISN